MNKINLSKVKDRLSVLKGSNFSLSLDNYLKVLPKSLWVFHLNSGSCNGCDIEIVASITPRYDIERFGMKLTGTPRHADVLLVTGPVTRFMKEKLETVYAQMPDPKVVIAVGNCAVSGDVYYRSYNLVGPVDKIIPVDVYVHGCAVRPEAIIEGAAKAITLLEAKRRSFVEETVK